MQLQYIINELDRGITKAKTELVFLEERKDALIKLDKQYPNAHYEHGSICLDNIWDKISCMRLSRKYRYYHSQQVCARFLLSKKDMTDGIKIHTYPYENVIANITTKSKTGSMHKGYNDRIKEICVLDYGILIPEACTKKKDFMKRIRKYIINMIVRDNLVIDLASYNYDDFQRMLLLK